MFDVFVLAVALSMDAFAISVWFGSNSSKRRMFHSIKMGFIFGVFQTLALIMGFIGGNKILMWGENLVQWIACTLLLMVGGKMLYGAMSGKVEKGLRGANRMIPTLAIATSIDAIAAGFTLTLIEINQATAYATIGLMTFFLSTMGFYLGVKNDSWFEKRAEFLGGSILILMAFKAVLY